VHNLAFEGLQFRDEAMRLIANTN